MLAFRVYSVFFSLREAHCGCLVPGLPQNSGAGFGRGDVVDGVFHDEAVVGASDCQGAARASFTNHDADDGHAKAEHLSQVDRNGFSLRVSQP